jgi:hypothetical protein
MGGFNMESVLAIVLFDLAFIAPPLAVVIGVVLLAMPARPKVITSTQATAHAA